MRWLKLLRDVRAESGRALLMLLAMGFALFAVSAMLGAYGIVTREVAANYTATNPAHATIDVGAVTPEMLELARNTPGVVDAEARSVVEARVKVGNEWMRMLLFVVDDFAAMRMNRFTPISGAWPPPDGTLLLERMAVGVIGAGEGGTVTVKTPNGAATTLPVSGIVHDTTLAPAWQEQSGYGYLSMKTFASLGERPVFEELRVLFDGSPTQAEIDEQALALAEAVKAQGAEVHAVKVPPPGQHPHQGQISSGLLMFLAMAILALILAAVLVAAVLAAMLARQVREISVMKAVGAGGGQIAAMYLVALLALGGLAVLISLPLGVLAAGGLSVVMADTMNFRIVDFSAPLWTYAVVVLSGLLTPAIAALPAIAGASRITVREAMSATGVASRFGSGPAARALAASGGLSLTSRLAARNTLRRPGRLILSLTLLATGGALFVTALSAGEGWRALAATALTDRHYDVEYRLADRVSEAALADALTASRAVAGYEIWGTEETAFAADGRLDVMRTYPDRGHGSFAILGVPPATKLVSLPLIEGRWLTAADTDAVVLSQQNHRQGGGPKLGERVTLSIGGKPVGFTLIGVVREIGGGGAYVPIGTYDSLAGPEGRQLVRLVLDRSSGTPAALGAVEGALDAAGIAVERAMPIDTLYDALVGHVEVPVTMLVAAAVLLALIGGLGLASMASISVLERTREIGIMKAVGALPRTIIAIVVGEGAFVAGLSFIVALVLALPLIVGIGSFGAVMFGTPLPFMVSTAGALLWLGLILAIGLASSAIPAWRAGRLVVREALSYT